MAGTLAPDLGFFPRGPAAFSSRVHHERTGDFLRALQQEAAGDLERAFVAGWALHLCTDLAVHPLVDQTLAEDTKAPMDHRIRSELRHKRLEWGLDCELLERPELAFLWAVELSFPRRPAEPGLLSAVGTRFYGQEAREVLVQRGARSVCRWISRLPWIFLWSGHARLPGRRAALALGRRARPLVELFGGIASPFPRWVDAAAVARPVRPPAPRAQRIIQQAEEALCRYRETMATGFADFPNADLDGVGPV